MGIFDSLKKGKTLSIAACAEGQVIPMGNIPDPAFSAGILGFCAGIEPQNGAIFSPANGVIDQLSDTLHAVGIVTDDGLEILVHVGIDTVAMKGEGFTPAVRSGDRVRTGQLMLTADLPAIRAAGHPTTVVTVLTNSDEYAGTALLAKGKVKKGEPFLEVKR